MILLIWITERLCFHPGISYMKEWFSFYFSTCVLKATKHWVSQSICYRVFRLSASENVEENHIEYWGQVLHKYGKYTYVYGILSRVINLILNGNGSPDIAVHVVALLQYMKLERSH